MNDNEQVQLLLFIKILWVSMWVTGMVLAKGFWSTVFTVITGGLWSTYLIIEAIL